MHPPRHELSSWQQEHKLTIAERFDECARDISVFPSEANIFCSFLQPIHPWRKQQGTLRYFVNLLLSRAAK